MRENFTRKPTEVNFPSADWLSYLRTQLTVFVGGVCLRSRKIFQRCFLETIFSPKGDTLKSYKSKGICFTYKQQKRVSEFFISKYFFFESDFCTINPHFLYPISKMFCNFSLKLNMANRRHVFFSALAPEAEEHIK